MDAFTEWDRPIAFLIAVVTIVGTLAFVMFLISVAKDRLRESRKLTRVVKTREFVTVCRKSNCHCPYPHYVGHVITLSKRHERTL